MLSWKKVQGYLGMEEGTGIVKEDSKDFNLQGEC